MHPDYTRLRREINHDPERWRAARLAWAKCQTQADLRPHVEKVMEQFWDCPLDVCCPPDAQVWRATNKALLPSGWMTQIAEQGEVPVFATFKASDLGLSVEHSLGRNFHQKEIIEDWRDALKQSVEGKMHYRLEVGWDKGEIHPHVVCGASSLSSPAFVEDVYEREGLTRYLYKATFPWRPEHVTTYLEARRELAGGYVPRKSGSIGLERMYA